LKTNAENLNPGPLGRRHVIVLRREKMTAPIANLIVQFTNSLTVLANSDSDLAKSVNEITNPLIGLAKSVVENARSGFDLANPASNLAKSVFDLAK
jgi:hypothetical protein